jgi:hypothetical protein
MNDHWNVLYQVTYFYADRKSKMAAIAGHKLTLDPMGKCSNAFFSETTNMIKAKLYMIVHVEDHPRNIPAKFGSNWPSGFGEEA